MYEILSACFILCEDTQEPSGRLQVLLAVFQMDLNVDIWEVIFYEVYIYFGDFFAQLETLEVETRRQLQRHFLLLSSAPSGSWTPAVRPLLQENGDTEQFFSH